MAGMHRSGTSLTASVLKKAGVFVGDALEPGTISNPLGHFEDVEVLSLHRDILIAQGISHEGWTRQTSLEVPKQFLQRTQLFCEKRFSKQQIWGWKDPRTTLFLDFWEEYLPTAKFVLPYRSPWEVIDSLFRRGDGAFLLNPNFAIDVWSAYNKAIISFHQRHLDKCLLLNSKAISYHENALVEKIIDKFEIPLSHIEIFEPELMDTQVSSTHRKHLLASFFPHVIDLYLELESISDLPSEEDFKRDLVNISDQEYQDWVLQDWLSYRRAQGDLKATQTELKTIYTEADHQHNHLLNLQKELEAAHAAIAQSQQDLAQSQQDLAQSQKDLQTTQQELAAVCGEHHNLLTRFEQTEQRLHQLEDELTQASAEGQVLQNRIHAMQSSKLWKVRSLWLRIKASLMGKDSLNENT